MKRKAIISVVAIATFLSAFGGGITVLEALQQDQANRMPMAIAGNSSKGEKDSAGHPQGNPPNGGGNGGVTANGNSWGG